MINNIKGFSITLCFGKYGGFHFTSSIISTRICLGWVALTIYWQHDLEEYIKILKSK